MKPLTPTATAVLDALTQGPATTPDLRTRIGCGRSTLDKTLADLQHNDLVTRLPDDHPAHPSHWTLTPHPAETEPDSVDGDQANTTGGELPSDISPDQDTPPTDIPEHPTHDTTTDTDPMTPIAPPEPDATSSTEEPAVDPLPDGEAPPSTPDDDIKICRGCQSQMPKVCPTCWTKTSSYCGTCRRSMPARSRGTGAAEILSNGLPKLNRGQLAELVTDVMRTHPVPDHLGITGWTSGRIAVYLPGRSTGAIGNVLDKLASTGLAEQLGDNPKRYQLHTAAEQANATDATAAAAPDSPADTIPAPDAKSE